MALVTHLFTISRFLSPFPSIAFSSFRSPRTSFSTDTSGKKKKKDVDDLLIANNKWVTHVLRDDPNYFSRSAEIQNPEFLFIGCSGSSIIIFFLSYCSLKRVVPSHCQTRECLLI